MDAKPPQRAFFRTSSIVGLRNENMAPTMFATAHQRHKSAGASMLKEDGLAAVKIPSKRTAFGDVSNVVRQAVIPAAYAFKANNTSDKSAPLPAVPVPIPAAVVDKENAAQVAATGFLAPAQRPRNSIAPAATIPPSRNSSLDVFPLELDTSRDLPLHTSKPPQPAATRKPAVVFSNDIEYYNHAPVVHNPEIAVLEAAPLESNNWAGPRKSPRHSKSQPCLKNADTQQHQQKPLLRRAVSRLPVDRQAFQNVVVFSDTTASAANKGQAASNHAAPIASSASAPSLADVMDSIADTFPVSVISDTREAHDAPFVDAVENFQTHALPPIPHLLDVDPNVTHFHKGYAAAVEKEVVHPSQKEDIAPSSPLTEELTTDYLVDNPATVAPSTMSEMEERWEDDAEFFDDQAYTTAHSFRSLGDNTTGGFTTIVMPKFTAKIQNELDIAKSIVESSITPEEIDDENWDISMVAEYGDDIYNYMKELEVRLLPNPYYMDMQTEIQWSMRAVLMEWLIQVHARFNLLPETLFLTVNYIDRFLSTKNVSVAKLQLVGATAIFIAAKYEEIICPSIQEIVYMVDGGYPTDEILKAERYMLSLLGFELGWPGPMSFLRRISKADDYDVDTRTLAKYFLEVTLMDERFVACPPSFLAAGAHCLARLMLYKGDWTTAHTHYSGYTWSQVRPLASTILQCCRNAKSHHAAVYDKYAGGKFKKASIYVEEEIAHGFVMPPLQP